MSQLAHEQPFDIVATLTPLRRAISFGVMIRWALYGIIAGSLLGSVILLIDRLLLSTTDAGTIAPYLALAAVCLGAMVGVLAALRRRPTMLDAARAADRHFALHDRLTTALELRSASAPFAALQRDDTASQTDALSLRESRGRVVDRRAVIGAVLALALLVVLLLIGVSSAHHATAAAISDASRIHRTAARVPSLIHTVNRNLTPSTRQSAAIRKLNAALARLQRQLLHTSTRPAALRSISATQQQLRRLSTGLHPISPHAVSQLNHALAPPVKPHSSPNASHAANRAALARATQALNRLARSLSHLTAAQRAALAAKLARAANANSDRQLRAALHQAASSLAYNDPQTAAASLRQAASALAQSPAAAGAKSQLSAATSELDALKGQISGVSRSGGGGKGASGGQGSNSGSSSTGKGQGGAGGKGGTGSGQHGKGAGSGKGGGHGSGQGSGSSNGQGTGAGQGQGSGRGHGSGQGTGAGAGQGSGGTGTHGTGGGRGGAGPHGHGRFTTVFMPHSNQGKGPQTVQTGPNGAPLPGSFVPYQEVLQRYAASAHQALGRSALPPSLQQYVKNYFNAISR